MEVKTYLDATMFEETQFSAEQIKNSTPNVKTYVIMEDNQVGEEKISAARYDNTINEMFVFRGSGENRNFSAEVLADYYNEIKASVKGIKSDYEIKAPGRLINIVK
ncbi:MAG: Bpu10I family restriction endonuclease [Oscillospiraceae bacterium]|nr:Bpu10I family restriction endonuclease [Oscillospiraceae bacterium]